MVKGQLLPIFHPLIIVHGFHHLTDVFQHIFMISADLELQSPLSSFLLKNRKQFHMACELRLKKPGFLFHGTGIDNIRQFPVRLLGFYLWRFRLRLDCLSLILVCIKCV